MEKRRKVSVKELVKMFVAISYLQEQRIIKYSDIYQYIYTNYPYSKCDFTALRDEAKETIEELVGDGTLSVIYSNDSGGIYRVNDKINFLELSKYSKDYIEDMDMAFFDIITDYKLIEFELPIIENSFPPSNIQDKNSRNNEKGGLVMIISASSRRAVTSAERKSPSPSK